MTVDQSQQPGNLPAVPSGNTGLEDFNLDDAIIPRLSIQHRFAQFKDNLSGQEFDKLNMVILGLVKQRILWHHVVDDSKNESPMCKSPDFTTGFPDQNPPRGKEFPWAKAGFNPADYPVDGKGNQPLPCANCQLKEWETHPNGKTPYCAEQWTLCVMYDPNEDGSWVPAYLTLQKSSLKPIRSYLTSFARSGRPAYTQICEASLKLNQRGQVEYSVPNFVGVGPSDPNAWLSFSEQYDSMREYLTAAPTPPEDEGGPAAAPAQDNSWNTNQNQGGQDPWAPPAQQPNAADPWQSGQAAQQAPSPQQNVPQQQATQQQPTEQQPRVSEPSPQQPTSSPTPSSSPAPAPAPAAPASSTPPAPQTPVQTPAPQGEAPKGGTQGGSDLPF